MYACVRILSRVCDDGCVGCALRISSAPHFFSRVKPATERDFLVDLSTRKH